MQRIRRVCYHYCVNCGSQLQVDPTMIAEELQVQSAHSTYGGNRENVPA